MTGEDENGKYIMLSSVLYLHRYKNILVRGYITKQIFIPIAETETAIMLLTLLALANNTFCFFQAHVWGGWMVLVGWKHKNVKCMSGGVEWKSKCTFSTCLYVEIGWSDKKMHMYISITSFCCWLAWLYALLQYLEQVKSSPHSHSIRLLPVWSGREKKKKKKRACYYQMKKFPMPFPLNSLILFCPYPHPATQLITYLLS